MQLQAKQTELRSWSISLKPTQGLSQEGREDKWEEKSKVQSTLSNE